MCGSEDRKTLKLSLENSKVDMQCELECSGGKTSFALKSQLLYIQEEIQQENGWTASGNSQVYSSSIDWYGLGCG
uniref:Uncharacterized protein n=1 Tax=Ditylenchus dipsaci TaxID=166011 RepID=A0A915DDT4_9BILA